MKCRTLLFLVILISGRSVKSQTFNYPNSQLDIANNNDYSTFHLLDTVVPSYNVFFSGENHQFRASNAKLEVKLLKYLHEKAGVRHLLLEFGHTSGYLVDQYVNHNDTGAYKILKTYFADTYMWLFEQVKKFSSKLDSSLKVQVHGIDFEDNMFLTVATIVKIMPDREAPGEIGLHIETLRNMESRYGKYSSNAYPYLGSGIYGNPYQADNTMQEVLDNYDKCKVQYDTFFGPQSGAFNDIMEHVRYYLEWRGYISSGKMQERPYRERYMFKNFLALSEKYPGEKFFGQFGRCHTSFNRTDADCDVNYYNSLVGKINNYPNDFLKNKVCVIAGIYPNIEFNTFKLNSYDVLMKLKKAASDTSITLFPVLNDSIHYGELYKHYKFIFINNNTPVRENNMAYTDKHKSHSGASDIDMFIGLSYTPQVLGFNTNQLDAFYDLFGKSSPASPLLFHGVSYMLLDDFMGNFFEMNYKWLPAVKTSLSDTSDLSLRMWSSGMRFGHDLFDMNPLVNIIPAFGIGVTQMKLRHTTAVQPVLFQQDNSANTIEYKNPAFTLDGSLYLSTHIYFFSIGVYGGYQVDISSKQWRRNGHLSNAAPSTSLTGWFAGVSIGFFGFG